MRATNCALSNRKEADQAWASSLTNWAAFLIAQFCSPERDPLDAPQSCTSVCPPLAYSLAFLAFMADVTCFLAFFAFIADVTCFTPFLAFFAFMLFLAFMPFLAFIVFFGFLATTDDDVAGS